MVNDNRGSPAYSLGRQHRLLRNALAPLENHLVRDTPAALVLLALKNLRYLSAAHEKNEHEILRHDTDYVDFEDLHRGLGPLWNDFIASLESALDGPGAVIGDEQILSGRRLVAALLEHWGQEELLFSHEFQTDAEESTNGEPGTASSNAENQQNALSGTFSFA